MTRQALFEAAWERPLTDIAAELGITSTGLHKICDRHDIPTPGRGYWAQVRAGKTFPRPRLRPVKDPRLDEVQIVGARPLSPAVTSAIENAKALAPSKPSGKRNPGSQAPLPEPVDPGAPSSVPGDQPDKATLTRKDLEATARAIARAKLNHDGFGTASGNGVISLKVSPEAQTAALSFLAQLLGSAQARGWVVQSSQDGAKLLIDGETIKFCVEEQPHKTPHTPTDQDLARKRDRDRWGGDSQPWPTWDLSPSGLLALMIEENDYSGLRRTYSQRKGHTFEESLDTILVGFAAHSALKIERRREAAEKAKSAAEAEVRRERLEAFKHREKRRMEFATGIRKALRERDGLRSVLEYLQTAPNGVEEGPKGMIEWLERRLLALDARVAPRALEISARHAEIGFSEPPTGKVGSRWYSPDVELLLWVPAEEEGRVSGVSELDWSIAEGLVADLAMGAADESYDVD